jgi:hypothetical protein
VSHKCRALFSGGIELAGVLTAGNAACDFSTKLQPAYAESHEDLNLDNLAVWLSLSAVVQDGWLFAVKPQQPALQAGQRTNPLRRSLVR